MEQFNAMRLSTRADNAKIRRNNIKALVGLIILFVVAAILLKVGVIVIDNFFDQLLSSSTAPHHSYTTSTR
jgi:hypothetical protein